MCTGRLVDGATQGGECHFSLRFLGEVNYLDSRNFYYMKTKREGLQNTERASENAAKDRHNKGVPGNNKGWINSHAKQQKGKEKKAGGIK
jgi:hypothetical protein